jgi:hypothetical protein
MSRAYPTDVLAPRQLAFIAERLPEPPQAPNCAIVQYRTRRSRPRSEGLLAQQESCETGSDNAPYRNYRPPFVSSSGHEQGS